MRYFVRPPPPKFLRSPAAEKLGRDLKDYLSYATQGGHQRRAPVDRTFLQHPEIAGPLAEASGGACAYCESRLGGIAGLSVSHHRPAGFAANEQKETDFLHYAWLAYDWENLYPTCERCTRHKENLFPVGKGRGPVGAPVSSLRNIEREKLLDPCFHDPSDHLSFRPDGQVRPESEEGETTILILALNREDLVRQRQLAFARATSLLLSGDGFSAEATGFDGQGWASEVLAGSRVAHDHRGGISLALLQLARRAGLPSDRLGTLLEYLRRQPAPVIADLLQVRLSGMPEARPAASRPPPKPVRKAPPSRVFRVDRQPLATMPITSIRIRNFKALRALDFALPVTVEDPELVPCVLLLGENAAGKSSVLEAVTLALLGRHEAEALDQLLIDDEVKPRDVARRPDPTDFDIVTEEPVEIEIGFLSVAETARLFGQSYAGTFDGSETTAKVLLAYGPRRFFTSRKSRRMRAPAHRVRSLFDPMATIANPLDWLLRCDPKVFDSAVRALREILMLGPTAEFTREDGRLLIQTEMGQLPLEDMSVGYKSVIAMATDIMRELMYHYDNIEYAHAVVLIDEIETHLHPRWKMRIVGLLRRAFPKVQFIITTHDPLCLRGVYDGEVFVMRRRQDTGEVELVDDLPGIRGMRAEQILMSEFFGLGSTDPETDAKMIRYHNLVIQGAETDEVERLRGEIQSTMKVGDTLQEQVFAEAMSKAEIDPFAPLAKVRTKPRREMVEDLLGAIAELRQGQGAGAKE